MFRDIQRKPQTKPMRILFVGSFGHGKGADVMVKALDRFKEQSSFELIAVGPPDPLFVRRLESEVSAELWQKIRFKGILTTPEIARELAVATMMLYPTRCDNSPNAVKEAVVAGVPVVASAIGGIVDYVWPDRNGVLFEAGSVDGCLTALRRFQKHSLFSQGLVDLDSLNKTREYLSAGRMGRLFAGLYRTLADGRPSKTAA
jgi:glycosyltransferase involved in cell wall biosynthesis